MNNTIKLIVNSILNENYVSKESIPVKLHYSFSEYLMDNHPAVSINIKYNGDGTVITRAYYTDKEDALFAVDNFGAVLDRQENDDDGSWLVKWFWDEDDENWWDV